MSYSKKSLGFDAENLGGEWDKLLGERIPTRGGSFASAFGA